MVSIIGNIVLSAFKLFAGLAAHSGAMVSDAVHSASDVFSSIIVIIGVKLSARDSDRDHPYGHERMECVAAVVLSGVLLVTGLLIGVQAVQDILSGEDGALDVPGILAGVAAVVSIAAKEAMFHYTKWNAKKIDSSALLADAWHHRSDALSSIGALIGILGARMGYPVLDPIASILICVCIVKAAVDIFRDAVDKMVDHACDPPTEQAMCDCVMQEEGVLHIDVLRTRVFGNKIYVDLEIGVEGQKTLEEAHEVARRVHNSIECQFPKVKHIMVHVNPVMLPERPREAD
ncbi:MAG: cation diffusion facilitator family transporter [Eubacteriales bacterium]|nr:cation diffusion facilitator family transporter [Eubacteriales bacterium]